MALCKRFTIANYSFCSQSLISPSSANLKTAAAIVVASTECSTHLSQMRTRSSHKLEQASISPNVAKSDKPQSLSASMSTSFASTTGSEVDGMSKTSGSLCCDGSM